LKRCCTEDYAIRRAACSGWECVFELTLAFEMRRHRARIRMLVSGFASVILGLTVAIGLPATSLIALGILIGINFLSTGLGYIFASRIAA